MQCARGANDGCRLTEEYFPREHSDIVRSAYS
jgi:hypothetical protein